jgi:formylglycine-generating enzyme required for sulfatase activity
MAGNVWEWVADLYAFDFYELGIYENPTGPRIGGERVLRGGGIGSEDREARVTFRAHTIPPSAGVWGGFRCVLPGVAR